MQIRHLCAAALALLFASHAEAQTCGLKQVASYDMLTNFPGRVAIKVQIAGKNEIMMISTAGGFSSLTHETADALNLPQRSVRSQFIAYDAAGRSTSLIATAPSMMIGPARLASPDFVVEPKGTNYGDGLAGVLDTDVLSLFDVDFDFAAKKVNFFSQDHCPGQVVYWTTSGATKIPFKFNGQKITLPIELDGKELEADLNTGAPRSAISEPVALQVFGLKPGSEGVDAEELTNSDGSKERYYTHTFASLKFGGLTVPFATLHLMPNAPGRAIAADSTKDHYSQQFVLPSVILGLADLSQLHLYISYKEKLLYVTAAGQH